MQNNSPSTKIAHMRVLVVDDDPEILASSSNTCRPWGFSGLSRPATNEAFIFLNAVPRIDLILCDWRCRTPQASRFACRSRNP